MDLNQKRMELLDRDARIIGKLINAGVPHVTPIPEEVFTQRNAFIPQVPIPEDNSQKTIGSLLEDASISEDAKDEEEYSIGDLEDIEELEEIEEEEWGLASQLDNYDLEDGHLAILSPTFGTVVKAKEVKTDKPFVVVILEGKDKNFILTPGADLLIIYKKDDKKESFKVKYTGISFIHNNDLFFVFPATE